VSATYFELLGTPLVVGRMLDDRPGSAEIVVSEAAARLFWPSANPVGQRLVADDAPGTSFEVVGVVTDVSTRSAGRFEPTIYRAATTPRMAMVRDRSGAAADRVRRLAEAAVPGVIVTVAPVANAFREALGDVTVAGRIAAAIGALALTLTAIGAFGVFAYMAEERRREIGVRLALGAGAAAVVWLVLRRTGRPLGLGLGAGLLLSIGAALLLRSMLLGMSPFDPVAYLQVVGVLLAAAAIATWIPARRATRVDPAIALRAE
jgi:hypothetical protein